MNNTVLICCGARGKVPSDNEAASALGSALAHAGYDIMTGGGYGIMASIAKSHKDTASELSNNCKTSGITLESIANKRTPPQFYPVTLATTLYARKQEMMRLCNSAVVLPGGVGTLDELFELCSAKKLGHWDGKIVLFNHRGYYDHIVSWFETAIFDGYLAPFHGLIVVAESVDAVVKALNKAVPALEDRDE